MKQTMAACVALCTLMATTVAVAQTTEETAQARIQSLEAEIVVLEERIAQLEDSKQPPERPAEAQEPSIQAFQVGEALSLGNGLSMTITGYEMSDELRYAPAGGFAQATLRAKDGYQLMILPFQLENTSTHVVPISAVLSSEVQYDMEAYFPAQRTVYYYNLNGTLVSGLKSLAPSACVKGYLLYALPEGADTSSTGITLMLALSDALHACELRPGAE